MANTIDIIFNALTGKAQAQINSFNSGLESKLKGLAGAIASAFAAERLVHFHKSAIDAADAAGKLAQKTGTAVAGLSGWIYSGKLADASAEQLAVGMKTLSKGLVDLSRDQGEAKEVFQQLNIQATDASGRLRSVDDVVGDVADKFEKMPDGVEKTNAAVRLFGISGQNMIPLLNQGSAALREQREEADAFGQIISRGFSERAQQFNDNLTRMGEALKGIFMVVADDLLPSLVELTDGMVKWVKESGVVRGTAESLVQIYRGFASVVIGTAGAFLILGSTVGAVAGQFAEGQFMAGASVGVETFNGELDKLDKRLQNLFKPGEEVAEKKLPPGFQDMLPRYKRVLEQMDKFKTQYQERIKTFAAQKEIGTISGREALRSSNDATLEYIHQLEQAQQLIVNIHELEQNPEAREKMREGLLTFGTEVEHLRATLQDTSFIGSMRKQLRDLSDEWSAVGQNIAGVLTGGIKSAVDGVSQGIMGMIDGTVTWGQVFASVARSIISSLINVVIQWIAQMTLVRALQALFGAAAVIQAAGMAAAWAPAAVAANTATFGAAGSVGLTSTLMQMATGQAVGSALSLATLPARAGGGPMEAGRPYIVGEFGPEIVRPRYPGTVVPNGGAGKGIGAPNVRVVVVNDSVSAVKRAVAEGQLSNEIVQVIHLNKLQLGIPS